MFNERHGERAAASGRRCPAATTPPKSHPALTHAAQPAAFVAILIAVGGSPQRVADAFIGYKALAKRFKADEYRPSDRNHLRSQLAVAPPREQPPAAMSPADQKPICEWGNP